MTYNIRWRIREINQAVRLFIWRRFYRANEALKGRFGVALISGGTDCDGMRWANCRFFWTRRGAQADLDGACEWADGPMGGEIVPGREGVAWEANYVTDTRDRFAEAAGY